ncbi:MAG: AmmeMemoRadiSam system protein B [Anaerolineae bacterium]|nr:AmmeMemoRadiSam system protein B [Anaerolineae bacterium]
MSFTVRRSVIAGQWYPGRANELQAMIAGFFDHVEPIELDGEVIGLISPHAGYIYSGQVAAYAYNLVRGMSFDVVVVISPVHRMYAGPYATAAADAYQTPLGDVPLAADLVDAVDERLDLVRLPVDNEHSLEIQLPFLQVALSQFTLLPIMLGDQSWEACARLADALADALTGQRALLVASTDLSHFHHARDAERLDRVMADQIDAFDPEELSRALAQHKTEACGGGPVVAVMLAAQRLGADRARALHYAHSGHVTGDMGSVVGYAAGVIYKAHNGG